MTRGTDRRGLRRTYRRPDATALRDRKRRASTANASLDVQGSLLCLDRTINRVEIIKRLAVVQRTIALFSGFDGILDPDTELLLEHHVPAESQEKTAQRRQRLTIDVTRTRRATPVRIRKRITVVDAGLIRTIPGASESDVDIDSALRAGERNTKRHQ